MIERFPHGRLPALWPSQSRIARAAGQVLLAGVMAAVSGLIILHLWVFWDQLVSGRLQDGQTLLRWTGGALLLGALVALRRQGVPLCWGRRALVVWLLVAVLHAWSASAAPADDPSPTAHGETAGMVLPVTAATLIGLLGLMAGLGRIPRSSPLRPIAAAPRAGGHLLVAAWAGCIRTPRAPPLLPA